MINTSIDALRPLVAPLVRMSGVLAQALTRLSDDADEVWEPFLSDPALGIAVADEPLVA